MISLFAFILVIGIVVDDAIVVGESVYAQSRKGNRVMRAINGTNMVAKPVFLAVLTTICAFAPMLFLSGTTGKVWAIILQWLFYAGVFSR